MSNALPENPYFNRYDDGKSVIINCIDITLTQALVPYVPLGPKHVAPVSERHLVVYGNVVTIGENLVNRGRNIEIRARRIKTTGQVSVVVDGADPKIDFKAGQQPEQMDQSAGATGTKGANGSDGLDAGSIVMYAELLEGSLILSAKGGRGGRGQDGHDGVRGSHPDPAADAKISDGKCVGNDSPYAGSKGHKGGKGGKGGDAGNSGKGGKGGTIVQGFVGPLKAKEITTDIRGGDGGAKPDNGKPGAKGPGGLGGRSRVCIPRFNAGANCSWGDRAQSGPDGDLGDPSSKKTSPGLTGTKGTLQTVSATYDTLATQLSPSQCQMLFAFAGETFLSENYDRAKTLYVWLSSVTRAIPDDGTYTKGELVHLQNINKRSLIYVSYFNNSYNFYGKPLNFVPVLSLNYLQTYINEMLQLGHDIQQSYLDFQHEKDALKALDQQIAKCKKAILKVEGEIKSNRQDITKSEKDIKALWGMITKQQDILANSSAAFQRAVEVKSEECTFEDVLSALLMIAQFSLAAFDVISAVGAAASAVSAGKAAEEAVEEAEKEANAIDKIIKKIKAIKSGTKTFLDILKNFQGGYKTLSSYISDDEASRDAAKMATTEADFDKLVKPYLDLPEAEKYQEDMHHFFDLIQAHNQKIMEYDSLHVKEAFLEGELGHYNHQVEEVGALRAKSSDPMLVQFTTFMRDTYNLVRNQLIKAIWEEHRALEYWSLALYKLDLSAADITQLEASHADLLVQTKNAKAAMGRGKQPFVNIEVVLTRDKNPAAFRSLQQFKHVSFTIAPDHPAFVNLNEVIVTRISVKVPDIQTTSNKLNLNIVHSGLVVINDRNGKAWHYNHTPRHTLYEYHLDTGKDIVIGDLSGEDDGYIGLSPFTTWWVDFSLKGNEGLSLDAIKELHISFDGKGMGVE